MIIPPELDERIMRRAPEAFIAAICLAAFLAAVVLLVVFS
jgi:hypothetical protein